MKQCDEAVSGVRVAISMLIAALSVGLYFGVLHLTGNFHAVVPGTLYRSAQPTVQQIDDYRYQFGIRTIVNLRGENPGSAWYEAEVAETKRLGITLIDFSMSPNELLDRPRAAELVAMLAKAPTPLLIHCDSGADRSGLVAALYLAAVAGRDETTAEKQISIRFGHISLPITSAYAMDRTFESLEWWLGFPDS